MDDNADFITKLRQIEEMAKALGEQVDERAKTRAHHIAILARLLRGRLEPGDAGVSPGKPPR